MNKIEITAVTKCFPDGEKTVAAILDYGADICAGEIGEDSYSVQGRTINRIYVTDDPETGLQKDQGRYVVICLDSEDEGAEVVISPPKPPQGPPPPKIRNNPKVVVTQKKDMVLAGGIIAAAFSDQENCAVKEPVIEDFEEAVYKGLRYYLFTPKKEAGRKYPLVQFIGDMGANGDAEYLALSQGNGGVVWADPEFQKEHPCYVLVPQIPFMEMVTTDFHCDPIVDTVDELLWFITRQHNDIDLDRIYLTGQSQGCMTACELNIRHPGCYAASLLVAGQWDPEKMGAYSSRENYWIIVSENDDRAYPIMSDAVKEMELNGAGVGRYRWDALWSKEKLEEEAAMAADDDVNIRFSVFEGDSVLYDRESGKQKYRMCHGATWPITYTISTLKNWLFENSLKDPAKDQAS